MQLSPSAEDRFLALTARSQGPSSTAAQGRDRPDAERSAMVSKGRKRGPTRAAGEVPLPAPEHAFIVARADSCDGRIPPSTTAQIVVEGCASTVLVLKGKSDRHFSRRRCERAARRLRIAQGSPQGGACEEPSSGSALAKSAAMRARDRRRIGVTSAVDRGVACTDASRLMR
jgi:hypothetical protein